ncbi:LAMI_0D13168g1_1 [Lachancea mirantina]|uniref:Nuclear rim protein 1 n=1 Tax=Lachancea mirantina TaxID=1230905 RepID=A0A1G4JGG6_9SACH|nr:LAMI_0D13168g1_1 [Lachancea mirantina]
MIPSQRFHDSLNLRGEESPDCIPEESYQNHNLGDDEDHEKTLIRKIVSIFTISPYDWQFILTEFIYSIDWDAKANPVARPMGHALTFGFYGMRLLQDALIKPNQHHLNTPSDAFNLAQSKTLMEYGLPNQVLRGNVLRSNSQADWYLLALSQLSAFFKVSIAILLLTNAYLSCSFLFAHYQSYSLFHCRGRPSSRNVVKHSLHDLDYQSVEDVSKSSLWTMIKFVFTSRKSSEVGEPADQFYYELKKWSPGKFETNLFATFSPTCVLFLLFTEVSFLTLIPVLCHQCVFWFLVCNRYEDRIDDEICLKNAMMAELDAKLIKPKSSIKTQDLMIGASQNDNFAEVYPSFTTTRSHLFQTHNVAGNVVVERYNEVTGMFQDVNKPVHRIHGRSHAYHHPARGNELRGARVRGLYSDRHFGTSRFSTPAKNRKKWTESLSEPSTPRLRPSYINVADASMVGNDSAMSKGSLGLHESIRAKANASLARRRNSTSPTKHTNSFYNTTYNRTPQRPFHVADSTVSFSMDVPDDEMPFEEVARRGRKHEQSPLYFGELNERSISRTSARSSRNASISPAKSSLLGRRDSFSGRPPFR